MEYFFKKKHFFNLSGTIVCIIAIAVSLLFCVGTIFLYSILSDGFKKDLTLKELICWLIILCVFLVIFFALVVVFLISGFEYWNVDNDIITNGNLFKKRSLSLTSVINVKHIKIWVDGMKLPIQIHVMLFCNDSTFVMVEINDKTKAYLTNLLEKLPFKTDDIDLEKETGLFSKKDIKLYFEKCNRAKSNND